MDYDGEIEQADQVTKEEKAFREMTGESIRFLLHGSGVSDAELCAACAFNVENPSRLIDQYLTGEVAIEAFALHKIATFFGLDMTDVSGLDAEKLKMAAGYLRAQRAEQGLKPAQRLSDD